MRPMVPTGGGWGVRPTVPMVVVGEWIHGANGRWWLGNETHGANGGGWGMRPMVPTVVVGE
jgi:hypothetical protein